MLNQQLLIKSFCYANAYFYVKYKTMTWNSKQQCFDFISLNSFTSDLVVDVFEKKSLKVVQQQKKIPTELPERQTAGVRVQAGMGTFV